MKSPRLSPLLIAAAFILPVVAHAHPGHDGDHDFVWDFAHLASNPLATIACLSLFVASVWGLRRLLQPRPVAKTERIKRD